MARAMPRGRGSGRRNDIQPNRPNQPTNRPGHVPPPSRAGSIAAADQNPTNANSNNRAPWPGRGQRQLRPWPHQPTKHHQELLEPKSLTGPVPHARHRRPFAKPQQSRGHHLQAPCGRPTAGTPASPPPPSKDGRLLLLVTSPSSSCLSGPKLLPSTRGAPAPMWYAWHARHSEASQKGPPSGTNLSLQPGRGGVGADGRGTRVSGARVYKHGRSLELCT